MSNGRILVVAVATAMALVTAACTGGDGADDAAGPTADASTTAPLVDVDDSATASTGPTAVNDPVTLFEAGAEPRTAMRLAITAPQTETMIVTQRQEVTQSIGGVEVPSAGALTTVTTTSLTVTPLDAGRYEMVSEVLTAEVGSDVDPTIAAQLEAALAETVGLRTVAVVDDRGIVQSSEVTNAPAGQSGELASELAMQVSNPFPLEPVGVGARWEVRLPLTVSGLAIEQVSELTLVAVDGNRFTIDSTARQQVQPGSELRLGGGLTASVLNWDTSVSGSTVVDLTRVAPVEASSSTETMQRLDVTGAGELDQTVLVDLTIAGNVG